MSKPTTVKEVFSWLDESEKQLRESMYQGPWSRRDSLHANYRRVKELIAEVQSCGDVMDGHRDFALCLVLRLHCIQILGILALTGSEALPE